MAPFDFPASPATGDVYAPTGGPAYQWDGEKWKGGQPSGPQTEQMFDASGFANVDIPVPTWAKAVEITGNTMSANGTYPVLRVSMDGTTFLAGASDYSNVGPIHRSGTASYNIVALTTGDHIQLGLNSDSVILTQLFTTNMTLVRASTSVYYHFKNYLSYFQSAAANQYSTYWNTGEVRNATGLAIKALRVLCNGGTFNAGSWVRVKWLGDAAQVPISNAIPEAPNDGGYYLRRNGVWVRTVATLKRQQLISSTLYSRSATSEAILSDALMYVPVSLTSEVWVTAYTYVRLTGSSLAVDDQAATIALKSFDGAAYQPRHQLTWGDANRVTVAPSVIVWMNQAFPTTYFPRAASNNNVYARLYGNPNYANLTLEAFNLLVIFDEIEP
jgi:hypothetical protein